MNYSLLENKEEGTSSIGQKVASDYLILHQIFRTFFIIGKTEIGR